MSVAIIKGISPTGAVVNLAVTEEGRLEVVGGTGGGGGDASAALQQAIIAGIGQPSDPTAFLLTDAEGGTTPLSQISLLRGLHQLLSFPPNNQAYKIKGFANYLLDRSDTIATPNVSVEIMTINLNRNYLLIQNLPIDPVGDLWVRFSDGNTEASIGPGSIILPPGEKLVMDGSSVSGDAIRILGTTAGQQYTAKEF